MDELRKSATGKGAGNGEAASLCFAAFFFFRGDGAVARPSARPARSSLRDEIAQRLPGLRLILRIVPS